MPHHLTEWPILCARDPDEAKRRLVEALASAKGNRTHAAETLGVHRKTVERLMTVLNIEFAVHRGARPGPRRKRPTKPIPPNSVVYFVHAEGLPRIKIGTTANIKGRLEDLQASCPVRLILLCSTPGDHRLENAIHRRFSVFRQHYEWFSTSADLCDFIRELNVSQLIEPTALLQRLNAETEALMGDPSWIGRQVDGTPGRMACR